ncbi:Transcription factor iws1 [Lunasporangiospora selenospora]|uniref:Transcription factor iws1 n=1 Tax=Lunasporangiospora selenospora TaxID=979761 RepID=A0A9P6FRZ6_9FUNG|nr:Transcription factor iws1 [Lunasporangiospora selenospora]
MSSDKKRIERDIFGDDDDDDEELTQNRQRDRDDRSPAAGTDDGHDSDRTSGARGADQDHSRARDDEYDPTQQDDQDKEEDAEENIQLPSFKKKRDPNRPDNNEDSPREPKKKKLTKKSKPGEGPEGQSGPDLPLDPREQALMQLEKDFELALKSGKSSNRRRRKEDEDDTEMDEGAQRFVSKMREAAFNDIDSKVKNESALAKVRMLENVKKQLNKSHVHNTFLDNGILDAMKLWLEPLQDASLPSLDIIQDFLDILDVLPIQTDHLVNSGVGRVVYFYTKVDESRVTPNIKRKAHALVDKWSRPIIKLSQDYRDKKINYADETPTTTQTRRRFANVASSSSTSAADAEADAKARGVRVPLIDRGSYTFMPESSLAFDKSRGGKVGIELLMDKYKKLKSHMAKIKQIKRT